MGNEKTVDKQCQYSFGRWKAYGEVEGDLTWWNEGIYT